QHWCWDPQFNAPTDIRNRWIHVAHIYTGTNVQVYFNGSRLANWTRAEIYTGDGYPFQFGRWTDETRSERIFLGLMDDFRIYDIAFSQAEIDTIYANGDGDLGIKSTLEVGRVVRDNPFKLGIKFERFGNPIEVTGLALDDLTLAPFTGAAGLLTKLSPGNYELDVQFNVPTDATITLRDSAITDRYGEGSPFASVTTRQMWRSVTSGENLTAWWPFDGDVGNIAQDRSGNENNATLIDAELTAEGRFGQGLRFAPDTIAARMQTNSASGVNIDSNSYTLSAWFNGLYSTTGKNSLFRSNEKPSNLDWDRMILFRGSDRTLCSFDGNDGNENNRYRSSGKTLNPLDYLGWHHVAAVAKGNRTYFFIDGKPVGSSDRQETSDVFLIGNHDSGEAFAEFLDDVRIYSISLSDAEVSGIYGNGFGDLGSTPIITASSPAHTNPISFSVGFGDKGQDSNVTGFSISDIQVINGTASDFNGSGFAYDFNVTTDSGAEEMLVTIPSAAANDESNFSTEGTTHRVLFHTAVYRETDIISRWTFDEANGSSVRDVGIAHNTSFLRGDAHLTTGKFGKALNLDGSGDYAEIPKFRGIYSDGDFTISSWVNLNRAGLTSNADDAGIFCRSGNGNDSVLLWYNVNGTGLANRTFTFNAGNPGTAANRLDGPDNAARVSVWQHVACVMNGNERFLYVDGEQAGFLPVGPTSNTRMEGSSVRIGSWDNSGDFDFNGLIDDVRLYDVAFTDAEVAILHGNGFGDIGVVPLVTIASPTDRSPVSVTLDFKRFGTLESVTNFDLNSTNDLNVTGGTIVNANGSGASYTFDIIPDGQISIITISLPKGAGDDTLNEKTSASTSSFAFRPSLTAEENLVIWYPFENLDDNSTPDISGGPGINATIESSLGQLIGHWTFDETSGSTAANSGITGNTHDATLTSGALFSTTDWKFGGAALHLPTGSTGAHARVTTPLDLGGDVTKATFSLSAWFKKLYPESSGKWRTFTRGSNSHHHFMVQNGAVNAGVYANANGDWRDSGEFDLPAADSASSWHHIVVVSDAITNKTKLYLNGVYKGDSDRATGDNIYAIGNYQAGDQRFAEYLDDFRVYDFVLADSHVTEIHGTGDLDLNRLPTPSPSPGKFGNSLFLPESGYAKANSDQVSLLNELTLSMWAKIHNDNAGVLARNGQFSLQYEMDNTVRASVYTGGAWRTTRSRSILGEWAHHAMTYDGAEVSLFLNGAKMASTPASGFLEWGDGADHHLYLGYAGSLGANAEIDDFRLYNRALESSEISAIFNNGAGDAGLLPNFAGMTPFGSNPASITTSFVKGSTSHSVTGFATEDLNATNADVLNFTDTGANNAYSLDLNATGDPTMVRLAIPADAVDLNGTGNQPGAAEFHYRIVTAVEDDLLAWYTFDENNGTFVGDSSGRKRHARLSSDVARVAGKFGKAIDLNGDQVSVPFFIDQSSATSTGLTFSAWINPDDVDSGLDGEKTLFATEDTANGWDWGFFIRYRRMSLWTGQSREEIAHRIFVKEWAHVAASFDPILQVATAYHNGEPSVATTFNFTDTANMIRIGSDYNSNRIFDGRIDDVRIFGRPLSTEEIRAIWGGGSGDLAPAPSFIVESPTTADLIPVTLRFNQTVGDFNSSQDLLVTGGTITDFNETTYTFKIAPSSFDSNITIEMAANSVTNAYGRKNESANQQIEYRAHRVGEAHLVAWWKFDDAVGNTAYDSAGGSSNGTMIAADWVVGKFGGALAFGTSDKSMSVDGLPNELKTATISFWVLPRAESELSIINNNQLGGDVDLRSINRRLVLRCSDLDQRGLPITANDEFWSGSVLNLSQWNHVALTYDLLNKRILFYVDGILDAESPFAGTHALALDHQFWVGGNDTNSDNFFQGDLDDLRIYDSVLNETEISGIHGEGFGDFDNQLVTFESKPSLTTPIPVTVRFLQDGFPIEVTGFDQLDLNVPGGNISSFSKQSAGVYNFGITPLNPSVSGTVTLSIPDGTALSDKNVAFPAGPHAAQYRLPPAREAALIAYL
ncbi:MAG: LamG domain-containing protein, partial [Verrucomicrobia bacterium]|nr:LamG domain-containing protein [Verrucomicrobiota bacterium]